MSVRVYVSTRRGKVSCGLRRLNVDTMDLRDRLFDHTITKIYLNIWRCKMLPSNSSQQWRPVSETVFIRIKQEETNFQFCAQERLRIEDGSLAPTFFHRLQCLGGPSCQ